jgi:hypothetical protein
VPLEPALPALETLVDELASEELPDDPVDEQAVVATETTSITSASAKKRLSLQQPTLCPFPTLRVLFHYTPFLGLLVVRPRIATRRQSPRAYP